MRLIIAGSRSYHGCSIGVIRRAIDAAFAKWRPGSDCKIDEVISGGAKGIDLLGELWAKANDIPVKRFEADWSEGASGGPIRNKRMLTYALKNPPAAVICIHDGVSNGTAHMIGITRQHPEVLLFVGHPKDQRND